MVCNILKSEKVRFLIRVVILSLLLPILYTYFAHPIDFVLIPANNLSSLIGCIDKIKSICNSMIIFIQHHEFIAYTCSFIAIYLYLKIFGVLKKSDKLNFFYVLLTLILGIFIAHPLIKHTPDFIISFNLALLFIPVFLLHRFFNFLTKKYPIPFEKIGYYTSIECLNDFYNNHKNHKQIEETKEIEKTSFIHKILKSEKFNFTLRTLIAFLLFSICKMNLLMAGGDFISFICSVPLVFMPHALSELVIPILIISFMFIGPYVAIYLYLKIFGILKQSDKLNSFFVLFIFILGIGINYIYLYLTHSPDIIFYTMEFVGFFFAFFLHKFFNFLTKKFPTPFEQIGYYTSIEFVKDLLRPIYQKLRKDK